MALEALTNPVAMSCTAQAGAGAWCFASNLEVSERFGATRLQRFF